MKTLALSALSLMLVLSVNCSAAVCVADTTCIAEVDPWELVDETELEEPAMVFSGSFDA